MKRWIHLRCAVLIGLLAALGSLPAHALNLTTVPASVYQYMTTSMFRFGHTVIAGTNITRLTAGGTYTAYCVTLTEPPATGGRTLSSEVVGRYNQLYVTIPSTIPGMREMPGFSNAPRGTTLDCYYDWTSFAEEGSYTIGIPGSSITIGGGRGEERGTVLFVMKKPGTATGEDDACIP